jgi:hypothetical protein
VRRILVDEVAEGIRVGLSIEVEAEEDLEVGSGCGVEKLLDCALAPVCIWLTNVEGKG